MCKARLSYGEIQIITDVHIIMHTKCVWNPYEKPVCTRTIATLKMCIYIKLHNFNTQQLVINFLVVMLQNKCRSCYCSLMEKHISMKNYTKWRFHFLSGFLKLISWRTNIFVMMRVFAAILSICDLKLQFLNASKQF